MSTKTKSIAKGSVGVPAGAGTFSVLGKCQGVASEN